MIKIEKAQVFGWEPALRGMRNPFNSWDKSDSILCPGHNCDTCELWTLDRSKCDCNRLTGEFVIGPNDMDLCMRLSKGGSSHRKFMRMITVYVDITAPLYWWKEFDTYKVDTVSNSCSTMHKIADKEFTLEDFSHEHLVDQTDTYIYSNTCEEFIGPLETLKIVVDILNESRNSYLHFTEKLKQKDLTDAERKHVKSQQKYFWWQMIQLLPSSYNQKRTIKLNYENLANIWHQRNGHRLDEWNDFRNWIQSLPYSEIITNSKGV